MKKTGIFFSALLFTTISLFSCGGSDDQSSVVNPEIGSISLRISENISRTLIPEISMEPAAYLIEGAGPDGAEFSLETDGTTTETIDELQAGEWTVTVTAYNEDDTAIGSGSEVTEVTADQTSSLSISVTPYSGFGTLSLDLDWEDNTVVNPIIVSSLTPASGAVRDLEFTLSGSSASFTASDVATGYHTLIIQLFDNNTLAMGAVEVVRIVNEETTTGSYLFDSINQAGGSISVNITPDMADPLEVAISGAEETKSQDQTLSLSASVSNYEDNVSYVWYVNGTSVSTGETFDFDDSYERGYYRIDVTAYSGDGRQAGSSTCFVQVTEDNGEDEGILKSSVSAGYRYTMILEDDGTLWATGNNEDGQLGDATMIDKLSPIQIMSDVQYVAAGELSTMIIKSDGTLWATGYNTYGQLGDGTTTTKYSPVQIMSDIKYISAGGIHTMILKNDGTLWATGYNSDGQLGDGTKIDKSSPVYIMSDVKYVAAGCRHTMIIKNDDTLWATGYNSDGELGDGTKIDKSSPVQIMSDVQHVAAGNFHTIITKRDGTFWATGSNTYGQLGDGTTENKSSPVQILFNVNP